MCVSVCPQLNCKIIKFYLCTSVGKFFYQASDVIHSVNHSQCSEFQALFAYNYLQESISVHIKVYIVFYSQEWYLEVRWKI